MKTTQFHYLYQIFADIVVALKALENVRRFLLNSLLSAFALIRRFRKIWEKVEDVEEKAQEDENIDTHWCGSLFITSYNLGFKYTAKRKQILNSSFIFWKSWSSKNGQKRRHFENFNSLF